MRHRAILLLAILLTAAPAMAEDATQQAKTLFDAGATAYKAGNFPAAIQAFQEAYKLSARPGIQFSLAQAHRRQFYIDRRPDRLREAITGYRDYIAKAEQGNRRAEAAQALAELEPIAERLDKSSDAPRAAPEVKQKTRVMVSSQTNGAAVELDGGKAQEMPLISEVKPGKHTIKVTAAGYFPEERVIQAADGGVVALDIPLRERPAALAIKAIEGAEISVDGRPVGTTPLDKPMELTPGRHFVAVTKRGHHPFSEDVDLGRGESRSIAVKLDRTGQRTASYVLMVTGAAGAVAGGVFAGLAYKEQRDAQSLDSERQAKGGFEASIVDQYDSHRAARDDFKRIASGFLAGAVLVGGTGILLFVFDQPKVSATGPRRDDAPKPVAPARETPLEVSAIPIFGPGLVGATVSGRF